MQILNITLYCTLFINGKRIPAMIRAFITVYWESIRITYVPLIFNVIELKLEIFQPEEQIIIIAQLFVELLDVSCFQ